MMKNASETFNAGNQYEILLQHADAKYESKQYQKAESVYRHALQIRKDGLKHGAKNSAASFSKLPSEADVKFRIHLCCSAIGNIDSAISILESIPAKLRTAKIHYALARLYHGQGQDRPAIISYKEVLKKCPLAIDVILDLITLGENTNDVFSMISNSFQGSEWILSLIKAHSLLQNKEYQKSLSTFENLNRKSVIAGDVRLLCSLAQVCTRTGSNEAAIQYYQSARNADSFLLDGMDVYSYLLHEEEEYTKLESVASQLFSISELHPAPWVALGYRALFKRECKKAIYLAVQATKINPLCVQAIILKGTALRSVDEVKDALAHFRMAMRIDPNRFVCYTELVGTYLPLNRINEAMAAAHSALKTIGFRPNCLVLCASVHMWDPNSKDKALNYVDKALSIEPNNRYAIAVKANVLFKKKRYDDAIKFLTECLENYSSSPMHTILGNCYLEKKWLGKAVDHYTIALSLNPSNKEAEEGLTKVNSTQMGNTFDEDENLDSGQNSTTNEAEGDADSDMFTE